MTTVKTQVSLHSLIRVVSGDQFLQYPGILLSNSKSPDQTVRYTVCSELQIRELCRYLFYFSMKTYVVGTH